VNSPPRARPLVLLSIVTLLASVANAQAAPGTGKWSPPATLGDCPVVGAPYVVFPYERPTHATGPGAIVWSTSSACLGGGGAQVAAISPEDLPGPPAPPRTSTGRTIALKGPLAAAPGPYGRIVIAGASAAGELQLTEGQAGGPFAAPLALGGPAGTFAFTTAYLGDVALVSPTGPQPRADARPPTGRQPRTSAQPRTGAQSHTGPQPTTGARDTNGENGGGIQLRVQRYFASRFSAPTQASSGGATSIEALTVALDFRTDRLVVWSQRGSVYARSLPAKGAPQPVQRLGPAPPAGARIAAVASDDDRAIVAWTYRHAGQTSVYVSRSRTGMRFGAPQLLERFTYPPGLPAYVDSPRIVRLASESVMMAWTGAVDDHWAIRTAAIDLNGVRPADTISPIGTDALLAGFAPGPDDEVLALWTEPQPTPAGLDLGSQAIFAARGFDSYPGQTAFAAGEQVAPPGPNSEATVAFDPNSDRAVAAWRTGAGLLDYAVRDSGGP
jgi:hypothetical protein